MILRCFWKIKGEHAHLRVFVGDDAAQAFAFAGNIVLRASEFISLTQGHLQTEFWEDDERAPQPEAYQQ